MNLYQPKYHHLALAKNYATLCEEVAGHIFSISEEKIRTKGRFSIALSGGMTPKGIYALMGSSRLHGQFQWEKIHFFWGDERWVLPDDHLSNYRMVAESLLTRTDIPPQNIHPISTRQKDAETSARLYEKEIRDFFNIGAAEVPRFDLVLLGLGLDGHTASLFAGENSLAVQDRLVIPVYHKEMEQMRVTLTLPVINNAENIFFIVSGREKAEILKSVLEPKTDTANYPAQLVKPSNGTLSWFVDQFAALLLEKASTHEG